MIQGAIIDYLSYKGREKKLKSIEDIQCYIKRSVAMRDRMMRLKMAQKVILTFKRLIFRKRIMTKIVLDHVVNRYLIDKTWQFLHQKNMKIIEKCLHVFAVRKGNKDTIRTALVN